MEYEPSPDHEKVERLEQLQKTGETGFYLGDAEDAHGSFDIGDETLKSDVEERPVDQPDDQCDDHDQKDQIGPVFQEVFFFGSDRFPPFFIKDGRRNSTPDDQKGGEKADKDHSNAKGI